MRSWTRTAALAAAGALLLLTCRQGAEQPSRPGHDMSEHGHDMSHGGDAMAPMVHPEKPEGAWGFSHYVFSRIGGDILTTLVEGPRGEQVRCQSEDLPCSYLDLKKLYESGAPIPDELRLNREQLGKLVSELDALSQHLAGYTSIDRACAEGYRREGTQNRNMGIHMMNNEYRTDGLFDLRKPEMLLFAMEDGDRLSQEELGECRDGKWTGDQRLQIVGAAFILPNEDFGEDHVEGFSGPLDNWHTHYHTCLGSNSTAILNKAQCEERGGTYIEKYGWMLHVYAVPEFDSQAGVFAMWNPAIWPRVGAAELSRPGEEVVGRESIIFDFRLESLAVESGTTLTFRNSDHVFHRVKSGTPGAPTELFDSGDLYADETYSVVLAEPGEYDYYCERHPNMTGKLTVK